MRRGVLVAGASGTIGREVVRLLAQRPSYAIRALCHDPKHIASLNGWVQEVYCGDATEDRFVRGLCHGVRAVISCLGAPLQWHSRERRSFHAVDTAANQNLILEATNEGVEKFIYVSAHREEIYQHTDYLRAHEDVVLALKASRMEYTVIRPTELFSHLIPHAMMARWGIVPVLGNGAARVNPVHAADVAAVCVAALADDATERDIGGPEEMTRLQVAQMIASRGDQSWRVMHVPSPWLRVARPFVTCGNARHRELMQFLLLVGEHDCLAPAVGTRKFGDYLEQVMKRMKGSRCAA